MQQIPLEEKCTCPTSKLFPHRASKCAFKGNGPMMSAIKDTKRERVAKSSSITSLDINPTNISQINIPPQSKRNSVASEPRSSHVDLSTDLSASEVTATPIKASTSDHDYTIIDNVVSDAKTGERDAVVSTSESSPADLLAYCKLLEETNYNLQRELRTTQERIRQADVRYNEEEVKRKMLSDTNSVAQSRFVQLETNYSDECRRRQEAEEQCALLQAQLTQLTVALAATTSTTSSDGPLLYEEINNKPTEEQPGSVPLGPKATGNERCTCITSKLTPHRASACALKKMKSIVTAPLPSKISQPSTRGSGNIATSNSNRIGDGQEEHLPLQIQEDSNFKTQDEAVFVANQNDCDINDAPIAADDEDVDDDDVYSDSSIDDDDLNDIEGEDEEGDGIIFPGQIEDGNCSEQQQEGNKEVSNRRCTCFNSKLFPHRAINCALGKTRQAVTNAAEKIVGDVDDAGNMNARCNCPFSMISPHRRKNCALTAPVRQVALTGVAAKKRSEHQDQIDLERREYERLQAQLKSKYLAGVQSFNTVLPYTILCCFMLSCILVPYKFFQIIQQFSWTFSNIKLQLLASASSFRWLVEVLVVSAVIVATYHRALGWLVGIILRKALGNDMISPNSFNLHFNWIAVRLGLDVIEIVIDNLEWKNPPQFHKHANFVRIKHCRLSFCPKKLIGMLLYGSSLRIYEITVDGVEINLESNKAGNVYNFQEALQKPNNTNELDSKEDEDLPVRVELCRLAIFNLSLHVKDTMSAGNGLFLPSKDNILNTVGTSVFLMDRNELTLRPKKAGSNRRPMELDKMIELIALKFVRVLLNRNGVALSSLMMTAGFSTFLNIFKVRGRNKDSRSRRRLKKIKERASRLLRLKA